jgi:hypothetical protein
METGRMSRIRGDIWSLLARDAVQGRALTALRAAPDITERLIAAIDANGDRHFLVMIASEEPELSDLHSRGVTVSTRELTISGHDSGRYLDVECHEVAGYDVFDLIGGEFADRLAGGRESAGEIVARVLAKWRRFWGQKTGQMLTRGQQLGLFAELWFLSVWLIPKVGAAEAVRRWRGPFASIHDFEWPARAVEVKATTSTRGRVHWINGLDQLSPPQRGDFLLFSLRVREEGGATNTLPTMVAACRRQIESEPEALNQFESALHQTGYLPAHDYEYAKIRLHVLEEGLFAVRDDFPRLTPAQLPEGVPSGVERVEYEINLGGFNHLCIARNTTEAPPF